MAKVDFKFYSKILLNKFYKNISNNFAAIRNWAEIYHEGSWKNVDPPEENFYEKSVPLYSNLNYGGFF